MSTILKAENISKQYRLGTVGTGTLSHDLNRWWHTVRGKDDPYLKVGGINVRSEKASEDYVWALRDINFEVKQGEVLGIIGKNGAGKSTLLKILSRVTAPSTGSIKTRGRIASLLEVGTGFHGELTGRENIFMNGAVLGMSKTEIKNKLDEIIDFSGCEKYIDTPVKRYSSGMTVRLGFAVAAHLEPEILVVDEVLAVGDADFQKKAIGKMNSLSRGEGRTVLFVSHNMSSIKMLCHRAVILNNGKTIYDGPVNEGIQKYLSQGNSVFNQTEFVNPNVDGFIKKIFIYSGEPGEPLTSGSSLKFNIYLKNNSIRQKFNIDIGIYNTLDEKILNLSTQYSDARNFVNENGFIKCVIPKNPLIEGDYYINILLRSQQTSIEHLARCINFRVIKGDFYGYGYLVQDVPSKILVEHNWKTNYND
jgi:lipopolysaccharide transport system ATP-binding protein